MKKSCTKKSVDCLAIKHNTFTFEKLEHELLLVKFLPFLESLNEPLSVISNYINGSKTRIDNNNYNRDDFKLVLDKILDQVQRANKIISRVHHIKSYNSHDFKPHDIQGLVETILNRMKTNIGTKNIEYVFRPLKRKLLVNMEKNKLQQALSYILQNSIEVLGDDKIFQPRVVVEIGQSSKEVELRFIDNGPEVSPELEQKLFDPQFNLTKYGTRLGLALSRQIIEAHGGSLDTEYYPLPGACFKCVLPLY